MANFNRIAVVYDFLKGLVFGQQLEKASNYFLDQLPENSKILIVGGGAGQILENFQSSHQIKYLELSKVMLRKAKQIRSKATIDYIQADILEWSTDDKFDFIVTPFILDCFNEHQLKLLFQKLNNILNKDGEWIQTDFYPKNSAHKLLIKFMYIFFNYSINLKVNKLADFDLLFKNHKFILKRNAFFFHSMVESKIYQKIG